MNPRKDSSGSSDQAYDGLQSRNPMRFARDDECETSQRVPDAECTELLHELNNVLAGVLLNTQVMEWKLPSYSRLKRNLHEVQRNAQRGGELVKRLLNRLEQTSYPDSGTNDRGTKRSDSVVADSAVASQEPISAIGCERPVIESSGCTAPVFSVASKKVPHTPV